MYTDWKVDLAGAIPGAIFFVLATYVIAISIRSDWRRWRREREEHKEEL